MSNVNLDFRRAYTPPAGNDVGLNFSLNPDGAVVTAAVHMQVSKPTLHIAADAQPSTPRAATVTLTLSTVQSLHVAAHYDNSVFRGPSVLSGGTWQEGAELNPHKGAGFQQAHNRQGATGDTWQPGDALGYAVAADFEQSANARSSSGERWQDGSAAHTEMHSRFDYGIRLRNRTAGHWQQANRADVPAITDGYQYGIRKRTASSIPYHRAEPAERGWSLPTGQGKRTRVGNGIPWQQGKSVQWGLGEQPPVDPPDPPDYDGTGKPLDFRCLWLDYAGDDILLNFGVDPCPPVNPPDGETIIVPEKRVYIVINATTLRRVDGNVLIPTFSMSLNIDADSWTWGFNASLPAETLDAIEPGSDGTPVELEAVINGTAYRVLAEKISRERTFGRAAIRVSGKGKSGLLDAPYAPVQNFSNSSAARTAQQLMNDALTVNGVSIGWTVNWQATDWLVPAGAWSHQGSYVSALNAIAGAAGAYIQPHPSLETLNVLSRYPTAPWNWGSVTPDFELPASVTTREGIEWLERPRYNRVFVSGQGQGVLGQVTRTGTAGDIIAPMVTDALITHADAARQRGLAVLGDTGRQAHLSLRLPVLAETGVIQPGKFVRYVDGGVTRIGIVRSTSVDVSNPEVWQTIGVETHVATA